MSSNSNGGEGGPHLCGPTFTQNYKEKKDLLQGGNENKVEKEDGRPSTETVPSLLLQMLPILSFFQSKRNYKMMHTTEMKYSWSLWTVCSCQQNNKLGTCNATRCQQLQKPKQTPESFLVLLLKNQKQLN